MLHQHYGLLIFLLLVKRVHVKDYVMMYIDCVYVFRRVAKAGVANVVQRIDSRLGPVLAFIAAGVATVLVLVFQIDVNLRSVLHHQRADNLSHYRENVQPASQ